MKIWKNIRSFREAGKMSQVELAKKIGVDQKFIENCESGVLEPSTEIIVKVADALKIGIGNFLNSK